MTTTKEKETTQPELNKEETMWAVFCHLSGIAGFVIPFGNIIGPLVIWLIKKDEFPLVQDQGKEALNFQISMTIYFIISIILIFVAIGILLLIGLGLFSIIAMVIAAIQASEGKKFRYPLSIRFID